MTCPCCGSTTIVPAWEYALDKLTPTERRAARLVAAMPGLTRRALAHELYSQNLDGGPDDAEKCISVIVSRANRKLVPLGFAVRAMGWDGYRVVKVAA